MFATLIRTSACVGVALLLAAPAFAGEGPERFVQEKANQALQILNDDTKPLNTKKLEFRALVDEVADVDKITDFVLGQYKNAARNRYYADQATLDAEKARFQTVFREYAIDAYEQRLGDYRGETLKVTGSTERKPGDTIVKSQISGGSQSEPLSVEWRVLDYEGGYKVVDVQVYGVWLAVNQREEVVSEIAKANGRISAATALLQSQLAAGGDAMTEAARSSN